ncbi:hypothetical protein BV20DRAFT_975786 [Pilatotrama ljubarskyi]|nr:hypothetical protein BV20DRAFT_975786 [Pilatotrama ljubarskyi]
MGQVLQRLSRLSSWRSYTSDLSPLSTMQYHVRAMYHSHCRYGVPRGGPRTADLRVEGAKPVMLVSDRHGRTVQVVQPSDSSLVSGASYFGPSVKTSLPGPLTYKRIVRRQHPSQHPERTLQPFVSHTLTLTLLQALSQPITVTSASNLSAPKPLCWTRYLSAHSYSDDGVSVRDRDESVHPSGGYNFDSRTPQTESVVCICDNDFPGRARR